jgi:dipeptidyl aminopeptidase/acylaminoacyl peptidase
VGGEEAHDTLSGITALIRSGIADPKRLAIMGGSHGGFMAAWLITQTDMFAAAICAFPVTDWFTMQFTSHNPQADTLLLQADPFDRDGAFFTRSPLLFARNVKTPTLCIAGGSDPECGPEQARMFYRALAQNGTPAELAIYPNEGHGIVQFEAYVDYCARIISWLETFVS